MLDSLGEPISDINIRNMQAGLITNSDFQGYFRIPAIHEDTLVLSHVSFKNEVIPLLGLNLNDTLKLKLESGITVLDEVVVSNFPEYSRFKQKILDTEPEEEFTIELPKVVMEPRPATAQELVNPQLSPHVGIAFDMAALTKKGREQKKMNRILESRSNSAKAYEKFNRDYVGRCTKLQGNELTDFIEYCDFRVSFLLQKTQFEIYEEMMHLLSEFRSNNSRKDQSPGA